LHIVTQKKIFAVSFQATRDLNNIHKITYIRSLGINLLKVGILATKQQHLNTWTDFARIKRKGRREKLETFTKKLMCKFRFSAILIP
jgi:hypothetical protein